MSRRRPGEVAAFVRIVLLCVAAAVVYGLVHDQFTARICLEYFTIGHTRMFATDDPTPHALCWGMAATWWVGLFAGGALAVVSRLGRRPKLSWRQQLRPVLILLMAAGVLAAGVGTMAYVDAKPAVARHDPRYAEPAAMPSNRRAAYFACRATHEASYAAGGLGGLLLCGVTLFRRQFSTNTADDTAITFQVPA